VMQCAALEVHSTDADKCLQLLIGATLQAVHAILAYWDCTHALPMDLYMRVSSGKADSSFNMSSVRTLVV
jgi:hypothetical protein